MGARARRSAGREIDPGLIVEPFALSPPAAALLIVGLALVGVAVQARAMWAEARQS